MRSRPLAFLAFAAVSSCIHTGPVPNRDPIVLSPLGVHGDIDVGANRYSGELLAITDREFLLLTSSRLFVIPFPIAGSGDFSSIDIRTYGAPWQTHAEQLRYASRYPQGIPAPALSAILRSKGQAAPDTVRLAR